MTRIQNVSVIVKHILEINKQARSSDGVLYLKVLEYFSAQKGIDLRILSVPVFLTEMEKMGFPHFESVRRSRQKLQAAYPELAACEAVEAFRNENEKAFRAYARSEL